MLMLKKAHVLDAGRLCDVHTLGAEFVQTVGPDALMVIKFVKPEVPPLVK